MSSATRLKAISSASTLFNRLNLFCCDDFFPSLPPLEEFSAWFSFLFALPLSAAFDEPRNGTIDIWLGLLITFLKLGESGNRYRDSVLLARMAATFLKSAVDSPRGPNC
ncbi:wsv286 [White spot syndrome virus]|uniref:Wsv286 n=4 Tax=White spot syndrome virus TaxID=342409 RepID=Q8VAU7_WSSVS|nr:wsv286 [Shrimp white spot syndrome virus]AFX59662.1 wsv286 [White spot syndrome virus]AAL33289.1 wsv286 [Shrimp white spot syndrome virus]AAL89209.1 WSSV341 [Shrimp white spot syndrome virus]AWQ60861.1 wsv286 [Shrimp white spot syndrome virus]AWQ61280.1 wsv286 [Shrimp white spot syndrome virus]